jgi:catechol 2,3-dioxygenase-like lactoylglutathione lyase family enzyme
MQMKNNEWVNMKLLNKPGYQTELKLLFGCVLFVVFLFPLSLFSKESVNPYNDFGVTADNVFLYYKDYESALRFYHEIMGFKLVMSLDTARMYHMANSSYVTPVKGFPEKHNLGSDKPITFTIVTDELSAWKSYLRSNDVPVLSELEMEDASLQEGFVALDPGGYYLNFVKLKSHPKNLKLLQTLDALDTVYVEPKGKGSAGVRLGVKASMTSFYYNDLKAIRWFYEKELGFRTIAKQDHAVVYHTSASGFFRIVDGAHGYHRPIKGKALKKGAMLSLFTDDTVKQWFDFIRVRDDVELRLPKMSDREELKAFAFNDYEDYSIEFDYFPDVDINAGVRASLEKNSAAKPTFDKEHYSLEQSWRGRTKSEKMFFTLGMMNAYAESVSNKAKILGLGEPLTAEETDELYDYAKMIAERNKVKIYREPDLLVSDLFPAFLTQNRHVILIYIDDTLDKYLAIKADKEKLVKSGSYKGEARKNIARRFAKLLSYKEDVVEQKLSKKLNAQ